MIKKLSLVIIAFAVITFLVGAAFIYMGFDKQNYITGAMQQEKITLGVDPKETTNVIDTMEEAQKAGDTVRQHRHGIAPTYGDLLGGKSYDATNPKQLTYAQAMNLENYLYLAVASFGLIQIALASGGYMVLTALALGVAGYALLLVSRKIA
jgi:hypothetical protein